MSTADKTEEKTELETHSLEELQEVDEAWRLLEAEALSTELVGELRSEFTRYEEILETVVTPERYDALIESIEEETGKTPSRSYDQLTPLDKGLLAIDIINGKLPDGFDSFTRDGASHYEPLSLLSHLSDIAGEPHRGDRPYEEKEDETGGLKYDVSEDGLSQEQIDMIVAEAEIEEDEVHIQEHLSLDNVEDKTGLLDMYIAAHLRSNGEFDGYGSSDSMPLYGYAATDPDGEWSQEDWEEAGEPSHEAW